MADSTRKRTEAVADAEALRRHLWRQFINTPGVYDKLLSHLEYVKTLNEPENNNLEDASCLEGDFHPSSESSRISEDGRSISSETHSTHSNLSLPKSSAPSRHQIKRPSVIKHTDDEASEAEAVSESPRLPPLSPRIIVHNAEDISKSFFHDSNIDQLPVRNSPVSDQMKAPLIRLTRPPPATPSSSSHDDPEATPKSRPASCVASPLVSPYLPASLIITASPAPNLVPDISCLSSASVLVPGLSIDLPPLHHSQVTTPVLPSSCVTGIQEAFSRLPDNLVTEDDPTLAQLIGVSSYFASTIHRACYGAAKTGNCSQFIAYLQSNAKFLHQTSDDEKMFFLLSGGKNHLVPEDFRQVLVPFISTHPHLSFFRREEYLHLHEAYMIAIVASMFFSVGAWRSQKMYLRQFVKIRLRESLQCLDDVDDDITFNFVEHFSYDQFYVLYVKFCHLGINNNNILSKYEFYEFEDGRFPRKVVDRIYEVNVSDHDMSFWCWVVFMLADIDKTTAMSMEFWYPVLNISNDGILSLADLREFYKDNLIHLIAGDCHVGQTVHWRDIATQFLDLMGSSEVTLSQVKRRASDKLGHILNACLNIIEFYINDENETSSQSDFSKTQEYVISAMNELE